MLGGRSYPLIGPGITVALKLSAELEADDVVLIVAGLNLLAEGNLEDASRRRLATLAEKLGTAIEALEYGHEQAD